MELEDLIRKKKQRPQELCIARHQMPKLTRHKEGPIHSGAGHKVVGAPLAREDELVHLSLRQAWRAHRSLRRCLTLQGCTPVHPAAYDVSEDDFIRQAIERCGGCAAPQMEQKWISTRQPTEQLELVVFDSEFIDAKQKPNVENIRKAIVRRIPDARRAAMIRDGITVRFIMLTAELPSLHAVQLQDEMNEVVDSLPTLQSPKTPRIRVNLLPMNILALHEKKLQAVAEIRILPEAMVIAHLQKRAHLSLPDAIKQLPLLRTTDVQAMLLDLQEGQYVQFIHKNSNFTGIDIRFVVKDPGRHLNPFKVFVPLNPRQK